MMISILSALLAFGAVMFAGGAMDPNGCPAMHAGACAAAGVQIDPEGRPGDQRSMIDPDGKPSR